MNDENIQAQATESTQTTTDAPASQPVAEEAVAAPQQTEKGGANTYDTILGGKAGEGANSNTDAQQSAEPSKVIYDFTETVKGFENFEFNQENSDKFIDVIKEMNLNNDQANAIVKHGMEWGNTIVQATRQQMQAELDEMVQGWGESAKQELGANFETTLTRAGAGLERLEKVVPNLRQALAETGAGNRVEFINLLAYVDKQLAGDPGMVVGAPSSKPADEYASRYNNTDWNKII